MTHPLAGNAYVAEGPPPGARCAACLRRLPLPEWAECSHVVCAHRAAITAGPADRAPPQDDPEDGR